MRKRTLSIISIVAVGILAVSLSACSKSGTAQSDTKNIVRIGVALDPPFMFRDAKGAWTSYSAELARKFGESKNLKIVFVPTTWPTMVAGLQSNKYDFTQPINATPERRAVVDFSNPISAAGSSFFVKQGSKYKTIADLNHTGVTIAVISGAAEESVAKRLAPKATFRSLTTATIADLATEVTSGRSDAFINSSYLAPAVDPKFVLRTIPDYATTPNGIEPVDIAFSVRKGDTKLLAQLNEFIASEKASGDLKVLADKWLTVENALRG